jgi:hypothetical protein
MTRHYAQNFEEEQLIRQFRRIRRRQVTIVCVITFIVWYLFTGGNLLATSVISLTVGVGRWFFFTWRMR